MSFSGNPGAGACVYTGEMNANTQVKSGIAALLVGFSSMVASAAYLAGEIEQRESRPAPEPRPVIRPMPPVATEHPVHALVETIDVGTPYSYRGLTLFPLMLKGGAANHGVLTMEQATARGCIVVRERNSAEVPEVEMDNRSRLYVFLMAGEIIAGGRQNRILRDDILLPPRAHGVPVPVYCGERERWTDAEPSFSGTGFLADAQIRKMAVADRSQGEVWQEIDERLETAAVSSSTRDYRGVFAEAKTRRKLDEYASECRHICVSRSVGVVAVSGDRILGCDIFSDPALFSRQWEKICRSYAMQATDDGRSLHGVSEHEIRSFIDGVFAAGISDALTPGEGRLCRIRGPVEGSALVWRGRVLHMSLFPGERMILRKDIQEELP